MDAIRASVLKLQADVGHEIQRLETQDRLRSVTLTSAAILAALLAALYLGWLAWYRRQEVHYMTEELAGLGDRFRTLADNVPQLAWVADAISVGMRTPT
jgi:hypothetical protein